MGKTLLWLSRQLEEHSWGWERLISGSWINKASSCKGNARVSGLSLYKSLLENLRARLSAFPYWSHPRWVSLVEMVSNLNLQTSGRIAERLKTVAGRDLEGKMWAGCMLWAGVAWFNILTCSCVTAQKLRDSTETPWQHNPFRQQWSSANLCKATTTPKMEKGSVPATSHALPLQP